MNLPDIVIKEHEGFVIVRDDLLPGGTKRRAIHALFTPETQEYIYASPVYGAAQVALAYAGVDHGKRVTIFCAKRKAQHEMTTRASAAGAKIVEIPNGYLSHVTARAQEYVTKTPFARLLPHGLDHPTFINALAVVAMRLTGDLLHYDIQEVWTVAGSGVLTRALQQAWPNVPFHAVQIGHAADVGRATLHVAPETFEQPAKGPRPPFPSCDNYDAKAWRFMLQHAKPGALFWNVK